MHLGTGTTIAGRYRLEGLLATGGMGEIWVAHHEQLDTRVAIKFMSEQLPRATDANPGLPASLNGFFERALARVPAERFQSGGAMAYEFALLVARHFGLPEPPGDVLQSNSLHHTPAGGGRLAGSGAAPAMPAAADPPTATELTASTATELTATAPLDDWIVPGAESIGTQSIGTPAQPSELRRRGRWTSLWAALAGAIAAGALV